MKSVKSETQHPPLTLPEMEAAITKIDRRIDELKQFDIAIINCSNHPKVQALHTKLTKLLIDIYGNHTSEFNRHRDLADLEIPDVRVGYTATIKETQNKIKNKIDNAIIQLESIKDGFTEELNDANDDNSIQRTIKAYEGLELHPKIAKVASKRYLDGHYADSIEASVKILNELVRSKSGLTELDGIALMTRAFGGDTPILRFNELSNANDREEQKGYMFLFSGAVSGLRNPRAHMIVNDDPKTALKFIAFISLLAELLDKAQGAT